MVGGLAIFWSGGLAQCGHPSRQCVSLHGRRGVLVFLGVIDDRVEINGPLRSCMQTLIITGFLFATSVQVSDLGLGTEIPAHPGLTSLGYFFTAVALLGLVNAFNLIDGLDGLSSGLAIIALIGVGVAATIAGYNNYALSVVVMVAPVLVFWSERRFIWEQA